MAFGRANTFCVPMDASEDRPASSLLRETASKIGERLSVHRFTNQIPPPVRW